MKPITLPPADIAGLLPGTAPVTSSVSGGLSVQPIKKVGYASTGQSFDIPEIVNARLQALSIPETKMIMTPERIKLRRYIAEKLYGTGATNKNSRADIVIGLPAAGKSSAVVRPLAEKYGSLIIDSDLAKELLPEFNKGIGSSALHKESARIIEKQVLPKALKNKDNIVLALLGKNRGKLQDMIDNLVNNGYNVHLYYNEISVNEAQKRAVSRFIERGRFVDPSYIQQIGLKPNQTYDTLKTYEKIKSYSKYSNEVPFGERPKLIESSTGKGIYGENAREGGKELGQTIPNGRSVKQLPIPEGLPKITPLDRFIAEGKIKINREGTRDVYSYKKGNEWQRARDSDSAVKAVTPKEEIVKSFPLELEQKAISIAIQKETIENSPLNQLIKYASKTGENKGKLPEVLGGKINGSGATSKFGKRGDDIVTEVFGRNIDSETARVEFEKFMARKKQLNEEEIALKQEIKDFKKSQGETQTKITPENKVTTPPSQVEAMSGGTGELRSLENIAKEQLSKSNLVNTGETFSLPHIIETMQTSVKSKINALDYIRTPDKVLKKIGLEKNAVELRTAYEGYLKELPQNINKITEWSREVPKESNIKVFKYLDGEAIDLNPAEIKVVGEIKSWLAEWADRLGLPKDNRIADYITHLFDEQLIKKEFDEDLAKIITDKIPSSVYDPFLLKRLGAKGYKQDTWAALDAYVKRGTRKAFMDNPLANLKEASKSLEKSQWDYVKKYADGINMRPTNLDNLIDNGIKQMIGYRLGQRPTTRITQFLRKATYRGMLGLNLSSALRNISQGINTYAKLGEKYTVIGYSKLLSPANYAELTRERIFAQNMIEDRTLSATKKLVEKLDKGLFFFFEQAERINRGSAYFGGKAKALAEGKTEEQAIEFGKKIVRDTQFLFGKIDTPVLLQSDLMKTLFQFQTFTTKQVEFLTEMAKNKEFAGLIRYGLAGLAFTYTIGQAFGMKPKDLIPIYRIGIPPSLKLPYEVVSAVINAPNKYGQPRSIGQKLSDISKSTIGYIPAGTQIKKTIQGMQTIQKGGSYDKAGRLQFKQGQSTPAKIQSILFGKYASQNAQNYFNRTSVSKSSNPFSR
jgi:hypothetical protein